MKLSGVGLELIKKYEGYRSNAYKCPSGVWTIGYGHTAGVQQGMTCTTQEAVDWLITDVQNAENAVNSHMTPYILNQNQFDALVSFTFNCGSGNLHKLTNNTKRTLAEIADAMLLYNKSNGKTLSGLVRRRKEERDLFLAECVNEDEYYPKYVGYTQRVDDCMEAIGANDDYDYTQKSLWKRRKPIAVANGMPGYTGKSAENVYLITLAHQGKLVRP